MGILHFAAFSLAPPFSLITGLDARSSPYRLMVSDLLLQR
jgi:hypothetical protein